MKKTGVLLLAAILLVSMAFPAFATGETGTISVDKTTIWNGEEVTVAVCLTESLEGVLSFDWSLYFDEKLFEIESVSMGDVHTEMRYSTVKKNENGSYISLFFADRTAEGQLFKSGTICTARFTAKNGNGERKGTFFVQNEGVYTADYEPLKITMGSATAVTVRQVEAVGITVETPPKKMQYKYKEAFNPEGLTLKVQYNNGTEEIVEKGFSYTPSTFAVQSGLPMFGLQGKVPVEITYQGLKTSLQVEVKLTAIQWLIKIVLFGWLWY